MKCTTCGSALEPSSYGGYTHLDDDHEDHTPTTQRELSKIADEIIRDWRKPYFGAVPYLQAMRHLGDMKSGVGEDDASEIVLRFLVNAKGWRGETARRVKAELKEMLKNARR